MGRNPCRVCASGGTSADNSLGRAGAVFGTRVFDDILDGDRGDICGGTFGAGKHRRRTFCHYGQRSGGIGVHWKWSAGNRSRITFGVSLLASWEKTFKRDCEAVRKGGGKGR